MKDPFKVHNLPPVIIKYLRPATTYRFRVKAVNKVGQSPFSKVSGDIMTARARKSFKEFVGCVWGTVVGTCVFLRCW